MIRLEKIMEFDIIHITWLLLFVGLVFAVFYFLLKYKAALRKSVEIEGKFKGIVEENESLKIVNSDYVRIVERSNDGITICHNSIIEYINDAGAEVLERKPKSIVNKTIDRFISDNEKKQFMDVFTDVIHDKDSSAFIETEFDLGWGELKHIEMSLTHILFGGKGAILAIFRDVTPRKRIERKLKENEILYRNLFEHAGDAIFIMDGNEFVDCNHKTLEMFRCSKNEILQKPPYLFSPERQADGELSKLMAIKHIRAAKEGTEQHFHWMHRRVDGDLFHAEVSLSLLPFEDKHYILAIVRDIDEKEKYKQMIEENNNFMSNLLDSIPSPVAFLTEQCEVKHCNIKFDEVFAVINNEKQKEYSLPEKLKSCTNQHELKNEVTKIITYEFDSELTYFQTYIRRIRRYNEDGFLILLFDITEKISRQKELENLVDELNNARNEISLEAEKAIDLNNRLLDSEKNLKELNSMKDKFFSIIAHDLRNPLSVFHGITSYIKDRYEELDEEEIQDSINDLYTSADKLLNLLENLLAWARSQTGNMEFRPENTDLGEISMTVEYLFKESAKKKGIVIENNIPNNYYLLADRNMLSTIFRNLTSNSIKFTESGGKIKLDAHKDSYFTYIAISDTGTGMDKSTLDKLFNPGEKISTKGTRSEGGTGLGLLMVKEFVDRHNGEIKVESELGKGSVFKIKLPVHQNGSQ